MYIVITIALNKTSSQHSLNIVIAAERSEAAF